MKSVFCLFIALVSTFYLKAQDSLSWIQRPENAAYLSKIDSALEQRFGKKMDLFRDFRAGALNFVHCETGSTNCSEEYVYNEAYMHEMMTLSSPIHEYVQKGIVKVIGESGDNATISPYMSALDPDKYWVEYYEYNGKYYVVTCLGVDREKIYADMGLKFGK